MPDEASSGKHSQILETQASRGRRASPALGGIVDWNREGDGRTFRLAIQVAKAFGLLRRLDTKVERFCLTPMYGCLVSLQSFKSLPVRAEYSSLLRIFNRRVSKAVKVNKAVTTLVHFREAYQYNTRRGGSNNKLTILQVCALTYCEEI